MFELTPFEKSFRNLTSYNPFREFEEFKDFFKNNNSLGDFRMDIKDNGDSYLLEADLPGFKKEDITLDVNNDYLTISAKRHSEVEQKEGDYIRCERSYGSFSRSVNVASVNTDQISALYSDGVLKLTMPKKENSLPPARRIEIK